MLNSVLALAVTCQQYDSLRTKWREGTTGSLPGFEPDDARGDNQARRQLSRARQEVIPIRWR